MYQKYPGEPLLQISRGKGKLVPSLLLGVLALLGFAFFLSNTTTSVPPQNLTILAAPTYWGKQNYIDFIWSCFGKGDNFAGSATTGTYGSNWGKTVNNCIYEGFKDGQYPPAAQFPQWGKQGYIDWFWGCFAYGDARAMRNGYWESGVWNPTVNKCLAFYKPPPTTRILEIFDVRLEIDVRIGGIQLKSVGYSDGVTGSRSQLNQEGRKTYIQQGSNLGIVGHYDFGIDIQGKTAYIAVLYQNVAFESNKLGIAPSTKLSWYKPELFHFDQSTLDYLKPRFNGNHLVKFNAEGVDFFAILSNQPGLTARGKVILYQGTPQSMITPLVNLVQQVARQMIADYNAAPSKNSVSDLLKDYSKNMKPWDSNVETKLIGLIKALGENKQFVTVAAEENDDRGYYGISQTRSRRLDLAPVTFASPVYPTKEIVESSDPLGTVSIFNVVAHEMVHGVADQPECYDPPRCSWDSVNNKPKDCTVMTCTNGRYASSIADVIGYSMEKYLLQNKAQFTLPEY